MKWCREYNVADPEFAQEGPSAEEGRQKTPSLTFPH